MNGDRFIPGAGGQTASAAGLPPNAARDEEPWDVEEDGE